MRNLIFIFTVVIGLSSCKKGPGEGGTSVIEGKVLQYTIEGFGVNKDSIVFPDSGEDVYIIYSDNEGNLYDDKFETNWDGTYRFEYLRKGDYTVFVYHPEDSVVSGTVYTDYPVFKHVKITSNNSVNKVDHFIFKAKAENNP